MIKNSKSGNILLSSIPTGAAAYLRNQTPKRTYMKVSIITVSYNSSKTICQTIDSVLSQDYPNLEYILVDGNSTDGTKQILQSYYSHKLRYISEIDSGIYDAMNKGIKMSSGDIIGIINADDFYTHGQVLSQVVAAFQTQGVDGVYGDLVYVQADEPGKIIRYWKSGEYKQNSFLQGWMPPHPTFFVKREIYEKYNAFDTRLKSAADYELMLRFIHKYKISVAYIPQVLVSMRTGGVSNASLKNRVRANLEDRLAWKLNRLTPNSLTLLLKPIRKIEQYFSSYNPNIREKIYQ